MKPKKLSLDEFKLGIARKYAAMRADEGSDRVLKALQNGKFKKKIDNYELIGFIRGILEDCMQGGGGEADYENVLVSNREFIKSYGFKVQLGVQLIGGYPFILFENGGDWETPVVTAATVLENDNWAIYTPIAGNTICSYCKRAHGTCDCDHQIEANEIHDNIKVNPGDYVEELLTFFNCIQPHSLLDKASTGKALIAGWNEQVNDIMVTGVLEDRKMLASHFNTQRMVTTNIWTPAFLTELKDRGYDLTTLNFSVEKLDDKKIL